MGVDDGAFRPTRDTKQNALLVAVLCRDLQVSQVELGKIQVDGGDANDVLLSLLEKMRFDAVMLSGISFGGFNVVDIAALSAASRHPVMAITGDNPDNQSVRNALRGHFGDWKHRWRKVRAAGRIYSYKPLDSEPPLYFEVRGASPAMARRWIAGTAKISRLPEPVRVARIIAGGLSELVRITVP